MVAWCNKRSRMLAAVVFGQEASPLLKGPMRGDSQRAALIAGGHESKQQLGAGVIERGEANFVQYDEVGAEQCVDNLADGVVGQPAVEHLDEVSYGEVADFESGVHGGVPAADEQMTLARPGRTDYG